MKSLVVLCFAAMTISLALSRSPGPKDITVKAPQKSKFGLFNLAFQDCGTATDVVRGNATVSPIDPLVLPGNITVSANVTLAATLKSPVKLVLDIKKKESFVWLTIPCIDDIGSCTYPDVCSLIPPSSSCPPPLKNAGIPCQCPFTKGRYMLNSTVIAVTSIPSGIPSFLADGEFRVNVRLYNGTVELGCLQADFTLKIND